MLIEAVGINPEASRLAGVRVPHDHLDRLHLRALCAGLAGLMIAPTPPRPTPTARPVDRAGRDPRGRHRRHVAGRRPVLADRHARRRAVHHRPSTTHHPQHRHPARDQLPVQGASSSSPSACSSRRRRGAALAPSRPHRRPAVLAKAGRRRMSTAHRPPPPASTAWDRVRTLHARRRGTCPVLATLALFVGMFGVGGMRYEGFADPQVLLNLLHRQRVPDRARRRHDVRDPHRRHRPVGRLGGRAVHDDRGQDAASRLAAVRS